jgi:hypothetical protein
VDNGDVGGGLWESPLDEKTFNMALMIYPKGVDNVDKDFEKLHCLLCQKGYKKADLGCCCLGKVRAM